jgi:large subunit ribosomal protein L44
VVHGVSNSWVSRQLAGTLRARNWGVRWDRLILTIEWCEFIDRGFSSSTSTTASTSKSKSLLSSNRITRSSHITTSLPPIPTEVQTIRKKVSKKEVAIEELDQKAGETTAVIEEGLEEEEVDTFIPPALTNHTLSILYAFTAPPPISALAALANRLALSSSTSASTISPSLVDNLPLLEQCLIHESFWVGVKELDAAPLGSKARIYTRYHDSPLTSSTPSSFQYANNASLATLGNALLGTLATELILSSFPHLPTRVAKAALTMYVGPKSLAAVASGWGIGPSRLERRLVGAEEKIKTTSGDRAYGHLVGGVGPGRVEPTAKDGAAGMGLIRWNRRVSLLLSSSINGTNLTMNLFVI